MAVPEPLSLLRVGQAATGLPSVQGSQPRVLLPGAYAFVRLFGKGVFAVVIKDLKVKSPWITQVGPWRGAHSRGLRCLQQQRRLGTVGLSV